MQFKSIILLTTVLIALSAVAGARPAAASQAQASLPLAPAPAQPPVIEMLGVPYLAMITSPTSPEIVIPAETPSKAPETAVLARAASSCEVLTSPAGKSGAAVAQVR